MTTSHPERAPRHSPRHYAGGCREQECRDAHNDYQREHRETNRQKRLAVEACGIQYVVHGITHGRSGFDYHQCRCDTCRAAQQTYNNSRPLRRKLSKD